MKNLPEELVFNFFEFLNPIDVISICRVNKQWFQVEKLYFKKLKKKIKRNYPTLYKENVNYKEEIVSKYKYKFEKTKNFWDEPLVNSKIFFNLEFEYDKKNLLDDFLGSTCKITHKDQVYYFSTLLQSTNTKQTLNHINNLIFYELNFMNDCNLLSKNVLAEIIILLDALKSFDIKLKYPHFQSMNKEQIKSFFNIPKITTSLSKFELEELLKNSDVTQDYNEFIGSCFFGEKKHVFGGIRFKYFKVFLTLNKLNWKITSKEIYEYSITNHSKKTFY